MSGDVGRVPDGTGLSSLRDGAASASPPEASIPSREWPEIEYEAGYPVDEDFPAFTQTEPALSFKLAGAWLLRELPRACEHMCCSYSVTRGKNIIGGPVSLLHFSTGGWSGAEAIIGLINRRVDMRHLMLSWRRGGHYVFEIPGEPVNLTEVRSRAWETRRAKYGPRGHAGSYGRPAIVMP